MTYLDWGCDTLEEECESCLDALCNVCNEEFKKKHRDNEIVCGAGETDRGSDEPDCDNCDLEKKPDCPHCGIILDICMSCSRNATCEFKICGPG